MYLKYIRYQSAVHVHAVILKKSKVHTEYNNSRPFVTTTARCKQLQNKIQTQTEKDELGGAHSCETDSSSVLMQNE